MSIHYIITPYEPTRWETDNSDLKIDTNEFRQKFLAQWSNAELETTTTGGISWKISETGSAGFFGGLQSNKQIVTFLPGSRTTCIDFIIWYRAFLPDTFPLYLFDSSSEENSLPLLSEVNINNVRKFILGRE